MLRNCYARMYGEAVRRIPPTAQLRARPRRLDVVGGSAERVCGGGGFEPAIAIRSPPSPSWARDVPTTRASPSGSDSSKVERLSSSARAFQKPSRRRGATASRPPDRPRTLTIHSMPSWFTVVSSTGIVSEGPASPSARAGSGRPSPALERCSPVRPGPPLPRP